MGEKLANEDDPEAMNKLDQARALKVDQDLTLSNALHQQVFIDFPIRFF